MALLHRLPLQFYLQVITPNLLISHYDDHDQIHDLSSLQLHH